jgi:hypothetical protein
MAERFSLWQAGTTINPNSLRVRLARSVPGPRDQGSGAPARRRQRSIGSTQLLRSIGARVGYPYVKSKWKLCLGELAALPDELARARDDR